MPNLDFSVESAAAVSFAASPLLSFKLRIRNDNESERIQSIALRCQIQIEPTKRKYTANEQAQLLELFGEPERWGRTLRSMLWTHASAMVPPFQSETIIDLPVPCTFDFNIAATKYFGGLEDGDIPLCFLFSGTVFYESADRPLQVAPISWEKETKFRLPLSMWREMMEIHYPNSAWLCLRRDVFDRLHRYKIQNGILTWEEALERVIPADAEVTCP